MLDADEARSVFKYDHVTGHLTRREDGLMAGHEKRGRSPGIYLKWRGRTTKASRLIWLMMTGAWPDGFVDHKDRDPTNNAWSNLRLATRSQNNANRRSWAAQGKGLTLTARGTFVAVITVDGATRHLGTFHCKEDARLAYARAAIAAFGEFACLE